MSIPNCFKRLKDRIERKKGYLKKEEAIEAAKKLLLETNQTKAGIYLCSCCLMYHVTKDKGHYTVRKIDNGFTITKKKSVDW